MAKEMVTSLVNLGTISAIPPGQGRTYVVGTAEIAIFRQRNGRIFAMQNRCPHRQGPLSEGLVGDGKVICPLHSHHFNMECGTGSEAGECAKVYSVEEAHGDILLNLESRTV